MSRILVIARREFFETVKTRAFLIGTVFMPLLMLGLTFGAERVARLSENEQIPLRVIAVLDADGRVFERLVPLVEKHNADHLNRPFEMQEATDADVASLRERVNSGELYAYIKIPADALQGDAVCEFGRADSQLRAGSEIEQMVNDAIIAARFELADPPVDRDRIEHLQRQVRLSQIDVSSGRDTGDDKMARLFTPFAFMFLLFMSTFSISQGLLTSVIEEKSSRVVEVLLSAVSPSQLMSGKVLGMAAVGAVLMSAWGTVGFVVAQVRDVEYLVTPYRLFYCALYFVPGFLLFASLLAAIGAACNTVKDAQGMATPLTLITIVPIMLWWPITETPDSVLSVALSFVPPATPFVMILRICADPGLPVWQIVATLAVLWASVICSMWAAGKVFRVGVLMYGKPASLREMWRWLRYQ